MKETAVGGHAEPAKRAGLRVLPHGRFPNSVSIQPKHSAEAEEEHTSLQTNPTARRPDIDSEELPAFGGLDNVRC